MKSVKVELDDATWIHACQLAEARGVPLDRLIGMVIGMLSEPGVGNDPILGSMRDESDNEGQLLAVVMQERRRKWDGVLSDG